MERRGYLIGSDVPPRAHLIDHRRTENAVLAWISADIDVISNYVHVITLSVS